jgi:cobyrinic acid a,c-diamide synthase
MTGTLQHFGYRDLETRRDTLLAPGGSRARGHEFHCSRWEGGEADAYRSTPAQGGPGLEGFARGDLLASYAHLHFAGAPAWAEHWAARLRDWTAKN